MNLADMAEHVCETVRKTDSDAVAACKGYLKRRDQMLWDKHLWRDSIFTFTLAVDPTAAFNINSNPILSESGIVLLPRSIDRVMGLRTTDRPLPVQNLENYFRGSLDMFAEEGDPWEFSLESPVVWQWDTPQLIFAYSSAGNDVTVQMRFLSHTTAEPSVSTLALSGSASAAWVGPNAAYTKEIYAIEKPESSGIVYFQEREDVEALETFLTMLAAQTTYNPYQRIRLLPVPQEALTLRILGKKKYQVLTSDYEEPRLRQAENVLIALATGDMFVRSGQVGAANQFYAEGMALLQQLGNIEFHQQANRQRIIPASYAPRLFERGVAGFGAYGKGYW